MRCMRRRPMSCASWSAVFACNYIGVKPLAEIEITGYQLTVQWDSCNLLEESSSSTSMTVAFASWSAALDGRELLDNEEAVFIAGETNFFLATETGGRGGAWKFVDALPKHAPERKSCFSTGQSNSISFEQKWIFVPSENGISRRPVPMLGKVLQLVHS